MKIKTSEATPRQLDWLVAQCEGEPTYIDYHGRPRRAPGQFSDEEIYTPSTDWSQGGPIIEREMIAVDPDADDGQWAASTREAPCYWVGLTPLVAAMRCFVASRLGDEVDVPEELVS